MFIRLFASPVLLIALDRFANVFLFHFLDLHFMNLRFNLGLLEISALGLFRNNINDIRLDLGIVAFALGNDSFTLILFGILTIRYGCLDDLLLYRTGDNRFFYFREIASFWQVNFLKHDHILPSTRS